MKIFKTITPYFIGFIISAIVLTIAFKAAVSLLLNAHLFTLTIVVGCLYGAAMFIAGYYWGKKDGEYLPIYDTGFRFHASTYLIYTLISELWFVFGLNSKFEKPYLIHYIVLGWGIIVIIHLIIYIRMRKNAIDDLDSSELFE